jgi:hypothetical protein
MKKIIVLLFLILFNSYFAQNLTSMLNEVSENLSLQQNNKLNSSVAKIYNSPNFYFANHVALNANNIKLYLKNIGNLKNYTGAGGGFWSLLKDSIIIFDQGPWIIGKINNKVHLGLVQWYSNYESSIFSPGPIINNKPAMIYNSADSSKYRIYKISKNDLSSKDYLEWPKEFGAPVTRDGKPKIYGDQSTWCVYNALDSTTSYHENWKLKKDSLPVMPVEIHQLVYSRKGNLSSDEDLFSNVVFYEYTIINKGIKQIDSTYFSFWADIDFSGGKNNFPACDSTLDLAYLWSNKTVEQPAIGYLLLYGPSIPKSGSKSIFRGKEIQNKTNLKLSSFHGILEAASNINEPGKPASSRNEAWNIAKGLYVDGKKMINPLNNQATHFMFSGDPVTNNGWLYNSIAGGEAGFNLFTGPFNLAPNDTQWVMLALVPANGKDFKESITKMKNKVKILKSLPYDSLAFGQKNIVVKNEESLSLPNQFELFQNYPNPFNPTTTIKYSIPMSSFDYAQDDKSSVMVSLSNHDKANVISSLSRDEVHVTLKIYDMLGREVATLVNENQKPGIYNYQLSISNYQLSSGVYFYQLKAGDFVQSRKMILLK